MGEDNPPKIPQDNMLRMAAEIVAAYAGHNHLPTAQLAEIIRSVYGSLAALERGAGKAESPRPIVPIKKSVTPDYIVCLEDGKKLKMLKRHLRTTYKLTPDAYRAKWRLPADYPMVAPNYAAQRSAFAKKIGLGRKPGTSRAPLSG